MSITQEQSAPTGEPPARRSRRPELGRGRPRMIFGQFDPSTTRTEALMPLLHPGDKFPALPLTVPGGDTLQIPDSLTGHFGVVLFFRGAWCPYCNAQLRAFQRAKDSLAGVDTIAAP